MRLLELFSGTGSMGKAFEAFGWEVVSLDIDPRFHPTICHDIRTWDYTAFPQGHFDFIHASPVCTHYSRARTTAKTPRDLVWADSLAEAALRIIDCFGPPLGWTLENPQTGLLKTRPCVQGHAVLCDIDYCAMGLPYKKRTRFWGQLPCKFPSHLRDYASCPFAEGRKHRFTAQKMRGPAYAQDRGFQTSELYAIPEKLTTLLASVVTRCRPILSIQES